MKKVVDSIVQEANGLPEQQLREVLAMVKGMDAANKINQEQGA